MNFAERRNSSSSFPPPKTVTLLQHAMRAALLLAALASSDGTAHAQCPAVGADTNCGVVLTILDIGSGRGTCSSANCISISNNQGPYDEIEDTLVGIVNSSKVPISSLVLTSNSNIFNFDGDGICGISPITGLLFVPRPSGCPFGLTGYEGPGVSFSNSSLTAGTVNFNPPIAPGKTAYFSLEESLTSVTACTSVINNSVQQSLINGGTGIIATFQSNTNQPYTLAQAAMLCGFSGWDWQSTITSWPLPSGLLAASSTPGDFSKALHAPPAFNDPPPNGYLYQHPPNAVQLPVYWNLFTTGPLSLSGNVTLPNILSFSDHPANICLPGGNVNTRQQLFSKGLIPAACLTDGTPGGPKVGSKMGFTTHLVGLVGSGPGYGIQDTGIGFSWTDTYNGTSGGIVVPSSPGPVDPGSGSGGITVTNVNNISTYQYPKSFGVSAINGNPVSSSTPAPPTLLGGAQIGTTSSGLTYSRVTRTFNATVKITNVSRSTISGPFQIVLDSLTAGVTLTNATSTFGGWPYVTVPTVGSLAPGQSASVNVQFSNPLNAVISVSPVIYSGGFN